MDSNKYNILVANLPGVTFEPSGQIRHLVKAGSRWPMTVGNSRSIDYYPFPFALAYTTALLKRDLAAQVSGLDGVVLDMTAKDFWDAVQQREPHIILVELTAISQQEDLELLRRIKKELNCLVIVAGSHATANAEQLLKDNLFLDYALKGEYELTAKELINFLIDPNSTQINFIKGVVFRESEDQIVFTGKRNLNNQLDDLPFPDREDFPATLYPDFTLYSPCINIISSRGCPCGCVYCNERHVLYNSPAYRMRQPEKVVDEMQYCIEHFRAKQFYFDDQSFVVNKQHVTDICNEIISRGMSIPWTCMGDAMFVTYETLELMAKAGCIGMKFGVESASPEILKTIHKPLNLDKAKQVVGWCKSVGIRTHATFCLGLPGETIETIRDTMMFMEELGADTSQVSKAIPYPGTPMYEWAQKNKYLTTEDLSQFDGAGKAILNYPDLSCAELDKWYQVFSRKVSRKKLLRYLQEPAQSFSIIREMWAQKGLVSVCRSITTFIQRTF